MKYLIIAITMFVIGCTDNTANANTEACTVVNDSTTVCGEQTYKTY